MRKALVAGAARLAGVRLFLSAAAACLVLSFGFAVMSSGPAAAHSPLSRTVANVDARNTTACPNETVAVFGKPTTLRFVLYGVSCRQAHSLIRTYFHEATVQSCHGRGNICAFHLSGGWTCSLPLFAGEAGGDFAGCFRSRSERFRVFRVTGHTRGVPRHLSAFLSPDREIWCVLPSCFYGRPAGAGDKYSASLDANGRLTTCAWHPSEGLSAPTCVHAWDDTAPVLRSGQVDVFSRFRCQAASAAITCTVASGTGNGKGFTISRAGVTPIP
jgi:hypothetical protein